MIFGFPRLWESYEQKVWPYIIPTVLPLAQIALTGMMSINKCRLWQNFGRIINQHEGGKCRKTYIFIQPITVVF